MNIKKQTGIFFLVFVTIFAHAQNTKIAKESFNILNLDYPGLEKVKAEVSAGKYENAAATLLNYYRKKDISAIVNSDEDDSTNASKQPDKATKEMADNALEHKFKPHKGYGYFDYGKDINWQYWPVKDNEVRWQLHRVKWWTAMAQVYRATGNENYVREWMLQFTDWAKKNPRGLSSDNDRFAWRALEVSERLRSLVPNFSTFVHSPNFTPAFLMEFLNNYQQQAEYLSHNYAAQGNHRLFEAQRVLYAGVAFSEFKTAETWRNSGVAILNDEIKKQVYPDGMQFELSLNYHVAMINTFISALHSAQQSGMGQVFPDSYKNTLENMIMAIINASFPDYVYPMFGDAKLVGKSSMLKAYANWAKVFPDNTVIQYYATNGKKGTSPQWLSKALPNSGFYTFRNGWDNKSTVMVLKASPPGEFHAQPDNGTFELWIKGRNFTPDAGCYVYAGDAEIMKLRNWYRQSRVHTTLTLNNENMLITKASLNKWKTSNNLDILTYTNPSYDGLNHQRSLLFIDGKYFLIIDKAIGTAKGTVGTHFQLKEDSKPIIDKAANKAYTTYTDGNNLLIQNLNKDIVTMNEEEGKVSYEYRKEVERPAFVFEKNKTDDRTQTFITILYPFDGNNAPKITLKENTGNNYTSGLLDITLIINGVSQQISTKLIQ